MEIAKRQANNNATLSTFSRVMKGAKTKAAGQDAVMALVSSTLPYDLTVPGRLEVWEAVLESLTSEQIAAGFALSVEECEFFPTPAKLRALAHIPTSGQLAREEALAALGQVLTAMRGRHGWTLKVLNGKLIDKDELGNNLDRAYREPPIPAPAFCAEIEAAIVDVGLGERADGLRALSLILSGPDTSEIATWHAGEVRRLEQRWMEAYARAKGKSNG